MPLRWAFEMILEQPMDLGRYILLVKETELRFNVSKTSLNVGHFEMLVEAIEFGFYGSKTSVKIGQWLAGSNLGLDAGH